MSYFPVALKNVIGIEKEYANYPWDNGGETMWGITKALARQYGYKGAMKDLPLDKAIEIYKLEFWDTMKCDQMDNKLAEFMFDFAVHSGWPVASKALQVAVGAVPDGIVGVKTLAAIGRHTPVKIMRSVFIARAKIMAEHEDYEKAKNGWFGRLFDVTVRAVGK